MNTINEIFILLRYLKSEFNRSHYKPRLRDTEYAVLDYIYEELNDENKEKIYQNDIQNGLLLPKSSTNLILEDLEKEDYVTKIDDSVDQRKKEIRITENGIKAYLAHNSVLENIDFKAFSCLSEDEFNELKYLIEKIVDGLRKERKND